MGEIDTRPSEETMRKIFLTGISAALLAAAALAGPGAAAGPSKLVVAMRDPGCHWFDVGASSSHHKYVKTVVRHGAVTLVNLDEASLKIKGPGGTRIDPVGAKLTLKAKGAYAITMVKQAPDDNHLKLTIK
jgi:hypothetical protein